MSAGSGSAVFATAVAVTGAGEPFASTIADPLTSWPAPSCPVAAWNAASVV